MTDPNKIWEKIFNKQDYAFDLTNQMILKNEFCTNKTYSWNYDYYDYNDEEIFIASQEFIKSRNKQPIFDYKNKKYISIKNSDFTYSILSIDRLSELDNPINYDLLLNYLIKNSKISSKVILSISFKKMKRHIENLFLNFISTSLKENLQFEYFQVDNSNIWKLKISYLIDKERCNLKKILKFTMILNCLIRLFHLRIAENFKNDFWEYDEDDDEKYFNIYIYNPRTTIENIFTDNQEKFLNYIETFDNGIILNSFATEELIEKHHYLIHDFRKLYQFDETIIFSYNYLNNKFYNFFISQKNRK